MIQPLKQVSEGKQALVISQHDFWISISCGRSQFPTTSVEHESVMALQIALRRRPSRATFIFAVGKTGTRKILSIYTIIFVEEFVQVHLRPGCWLCDVYIVVHFLSVMQFPIKRVQMLHGGTGQHVFIRELIRLSFYICDPCMWHNWLISSL